MQVNDAPAVEDAKMFELSDNRITSLLLVQQKLSCLRTTIAAEINNKRYHRRKN